MTKLRYILVAAMLMAGCDEASDDDAIGRVDELSEQSDADDPKITFRDACSESVNDAINCYFRESAEGNNAGANDCLELLGEIVDFCYPSLQ